MKRLSLLAALAERSGAPMLATNDVLYHGPERRMLQDVLTCIRENCTIQEAGLRLQANAERHLKSPDEMARLFARFPGAVERSLEIVERISFDLGQLRYEYPDEPVPPGKTAIQHLRDLTWSGAQWRFPGGLREQEEKTINHELDLIERLDYPNYFLTVHDIVRWARSKGILCQGRGSAANSCVCFCLGITAVDPTKEDQDLLFSRFISENRNEPPDIDVDFEHERREEVIQHIYQRYGRDRAGLAATVISYRGRSAIREVGKVFGLSDDTVGAMAGTLWGWSMEGVTGSAARRVGLDASDPRLTRVMALAEELMGFPRHLSQHVGGFVITRTRLDEVVPIENAAMDDRTVVEWDKDDLNDLGILKVDVLGLGMLSCLRRSFDLLKEHYVASAHLAGHELHPSPEGGGWSAAGRPGGGDGGTRIQQSLQTSDVALGGLSDSSQSPTRPPPAERRGRPPSPFGGGMNEPSRAAYPEKLELLDRDRFVPLSLTAIPAEDKAVYRMIQRADTIGVFQIESRAQMSMLPRLRPHEFYDLVIEVAIVRPGPIQGDMVHPYLKRREKLRETGEEPDYPSPSPEHGEKDELKQVLAKTLGVPLFQEQAMRIAIVAAGFAPAKADRLRRAMATFKRVGTIDRFREEFVDGMTRRGYPADFAKRCFKQIEGFGEYGFPESHAASFALLVYASAWIKCRYPDVFAAALLNSQPMGFYAPAQIVRDAQEHGVDVRPVDVNFSDWDCSLEPLHPSPFATSKSFLSNTPLPNPPPQGGREHAEPAATSVPKAQPRGEHDRATGDTSPLVGEVGTRSVPGGGWQGISCREEIKARLHPRYVGMQDDIHTTHALRLGLRQVSGLSQAHALRIESVRGKGFDSVRDLWLRTRLPPAVLEKLAQADAFGSLGLSRRDALWAVRALKRSGDKDDLPLFARVDMPEREPDAHLPPMPPGEQVIEDYRHLHLSLKAHPVSFLRQDLDRRGILPTARLAALSSGPRVTVAGLVLVRQRPGDAKAIFMTLEDETGIANAILWLRTFELHRPAVLGARLISVTGKLQNESGVIHVVTDRVEDLSFLLRRLTEGDARIDTLSRADATKCGDDFRRPAVERHRHPRAGDALVTSLKEKPDLFDVTPAAAVMPKGRNFH
ncbi:MAG: error-prone DNA polymerase [Xanthobacteraceae bacterium]